MEERPGIEGSEGGVSRRKIIQRIGVGTALAWSAPVLQSLASPAHAQQYDPACAERCPVINCVGSVPQCGSSGPFGFCFCSQTTEGGCVCAEETSCSGVNECDSSADCAAGQTCHNVCCTGGTTNQCFWPCGTNASTTQADGKPTSAKP
jgi:hypothetical protein